MEHPYKVDSNLWKFFQKPYQQESSSGTDTDNSASNESNQTKASDAINLRQLWPSLKLNCWALNMIWKKRVQVVLLLSFLQKSEPVAIITQYLQATFMHQIQWFCKLFLLILSVTVSVYVIYSKVKILYHGTLLSVTLFHAKALSLGLLRAGGKANQES